MLYFHDRFFDNEVPFFHPGYKITDLQSRDVFIRFIDLVFHNFIRGLYDKHFYPTRPHRRTQPA